MRVHEQSRWLLPLALATLTSPARAGIAASPVPGGPLLFWNEGGALVSHDDGATFHALPGVKRGSTIVDAAVGSDGTLYVLESDQDTNTTYAERLLVIRAGVVRVVAFDNSSRVVTSGTRVAVSRQADAAHFDGRYAFVELSDDGGRTFVARPLPEAELGEAHDMSIAFGAVLFASTEVNTCTSADILEWQELSTLTKTSRRVREILVPEEDYASAWRIGAYGWLYGPSYAGRMLAYGASGVQEVRGLPSGIDYRGNPPNQLAVANNGRTTIGLAATPDVWSTLEGSAVLVELTGADATVLDAQSRWIDDDRSLAVDARGRPLLVSAGTLWRYSRIDGWTQLLARGGLSSPAPP